MSTRQALRELLTRYVDMVNSGDCGFWNPEDEDCVKAARAALAAEDKAVSELVDTLAYIAAPQYGGSRGTEWDQLVDGREEARKALSKHAKE